MQPKLHFMIMAAKGIIPGLPQFTAPDLINEDLSTLDDEEALDLIGNLTIDMQDEGYDDQYPYLYDQLTTTYLEFRPDSGKVTPLNF